MLSLLYNKWFLSFLITLLVVAIMYYFSNNKPLTKRERKNSNKYYIKIFIIIYLVLVILFFVYDYMRDNKMINMFPVFRGGSDNIKIIDTDIDTTVSNDW